MQWPCHPQRHYKRLQLNMLQETTASRFGAGFVRRQFCPGAVHSTDMHADLFVPADAGAWQAVLAHAPHATLFHTREFLAYHGDRFLASERSLVFRDGSACIGVMPMAIEVPAGDGRVVARSPFGGSVGGPVFSERLRYAQAVEAVRALLAALDSLGADELRLTLPPACWAADGEADDTFVLALLEAGFITTGRDLHSVVRLAPTVAHFGADSRVGRRIRQAQKANVVIESPGTLAPFLEVLDATFAKHGTRPTHSAADLQYLLDALPDRITVHVARVNGVPAAGIAEFDVSRCVRQSFYLASTPELGRSQALSLLVAHRLQAAVDDGFTWYDFGTSSVDQRARPGVLEFKESFGAIGQFRQRLVWRR